MPEIDAEIDEDGERYPGYFLLPILQSLPMPDQIPLEANCQGSLGNIQGDSYPDRRARRSWGMHLRAQRCRASAIFCPEIP